MPQLYHYPHCPFCIRVRLAAGFLNLPYQLHRVDYDDEATPTKLIGKKMLPVWVDDKGEAFPESLDILQLIDTKNQLKTKELLQTPEWKELEGQLNELSSSLHSLAMPHWMYTREFTPIARAYFQKKKEEKRGPFKELIKKRPALEAEVQQHLKKLGEQLTPFYHSSEIRLFDLLIAAHIWGLYVVPEFQFSEKIHSYLQNIKKRCQFEYHQGIWEDSTLD